MVGVWWALTEGSAPCFTSGLWRNFISCYVFLQENPENVLEGNSTFHPLAFSHLTLFSSLVSYKISLGSGSRAKSSKIYDFNCLACWQ